MANDYYGPCCRNSCSRQAVGHHPIFDLPVCQYHMRTRSRRMLDSGKASTPWAHTAGSTREAYQGSIANANLGHRKLSPEWRIWEPPGPVTVRKWEPPEPPT